jgi:hypothetical protein
MRTRLVRLAAATSAILCVAGCGAATALTAATSAPTALPQWPQPGSTEPAATPVPTPIATPCVWPTTNWEGTAVCSDTAPTPTPAPTPPPPPDGVSYSCTGSAPSGIDITYGPEGSSYGASRLPFRKILPLNANAQYVVTTAQLHGSGSVTCTTTVNWTATDAASTPQSATNSGSASGGYNIASAQVCGNYSGGWQPC